MQLTNWLTKFGHRPFRSTSVRRSSGVPKFRPAMIESLEERVLLTTFTVNSLLDTVDANPGDGVALDGSGNTSLRAAIMEANALAGADTITLPAGTYTLSLAGIDEDGAATGDLDITGQLTINGAGSGSTTIDADGLDRVFHMLSGSTVGITGVTITGGDVVDTNPDSNSGGGGIYNLGALTLTQSIVTQNVSSGSVNFQGGGIRSDGSLTVIESTVSSNTTDGDGGGIFNKGPLSVTDSRIVDNVAGAQGGGATGGGITQFQGNVANILRSTVSGNHAATVSGTFGSAIGQGGGLSVRGGTMNVTDSTVSGNTAGSGGGGIQLAFFSASAVNVNNSTISGNTAVGSSGGGIAAYSSSGYLNVFNSTITDNVATHSGTGIFTDGLTTTLKNSIIADNFTDNSNLHDIEGMVTSQGYNLIGDKGTSSGYVSTDLVGDYLATVIDPALGPLADNGGTTLTHALLLDSPAIDAGSNTDAPALDQRGATRIVNGQIDIGAFEFQAALSLTGPIGGVTLTASTTPTFSWSTFPGADHYDLWVNDITTGQSGIIRNTNVAGTSFTPSTALPDGHEFLWTVRPVSSLGTNGQWAGHESFTLAVAVTRPGSTTIVGPIGSSTDMTPTFEWTAATNADHYDLWVNDQTTGQSGIIRDMNVSGTTFTPSSDLTLDHTYIWTVRAVDGSGAVGDWAPHKTFSIVVPPPATPSVAAFSSGTTTSTRPYFDWSDVPDAVYYDLWVNDVTTGQSGVIRQQTLTASGYTPPSNMPLTVGHTYIWTVRAIATGGVAGDWAPHSMFDVILPKPYTLRPVDDIVETTPTFTWAAIDGADHYDIWVNDQTSGTMQVIRDQDVPTNSFVPSTPLVDGHKYIWTVRAVTADDKPGEWADVQIFTVSSAAFEAQKPVVSTPAATRTTAFPLISWDQLPNTDNYQFVLDDVTTSTDAIIDATVTFGGSYYVVPESSPLEFGHEYRYRVRGLSPDGLTTMWSDYGTVNIELEKSIVGAPQNEEISTLRPNFRWKFDIEGADFFDIWVNDLTTGEYQVIRDIHVIYDNGYVSPIDLVAGHSYVWTVRAVNNNGTMGEWADDRTFSIAPDAGSLTTQLDANASSSLLDDSTDGDEAEIEGVLDDEGLLLAERESSHQVMDALWSEWAEILLDGGEPGVSAS